MKKFLFPFIFLIVGTFYSASAVNETQTWAQLITQGKITPDLKLWGEFQPRYGFSTNGITTLMIRPGLGWLINPSLSLWVGYAWTPLIKPTFRDEHRAWTQALYTLQWDTLTFTQRLRMEFRFIGSTPATAVRARYQARFVLPLAHEGDWNLALADEVMFNLNTTSPTTESGFDQNRVFAGIFYKFSPSLSMDAGYLWNLVNRPFTDNERNNHVVMLTLYHAFDLTQ